MANRALPSTVHPPNGSGAGRPPAFTFITGSQTIRTRLIGAFFLIVFLPMAGITTLMTASGLQGGRQQLIYQLQTLGSYKETELHDWIVGLKDELNNLIPAEEAVAYIERLADPASVPSETQSAKDQLRIRFLHILNQSQHFRDLFLIDKDGKVVFAVNADREGLNYSEALFYVNALQGANIHPITYSDSLVGSSIIVTRRLTSPSGNTIAILAGEARPERLQYIMTRSTGLGETGVSYVVAGDHRLLTRLQQAIPGMAINSLGIQTSIDQQASGDAVYQDYRGISVVGVYRWLPEYQAALIVEQATSEADRPTLAILAINLSVAVSALLIAVVASLAVTRSIAVPVSDLVETATQIAGGQLELVAPVERQDEIGILAQAFNAMTSQLHGLITSLEQRVAERTADLRQRTGLLEASAEVAQAAASILQPDELIQKAVDLIHDRFDLYYVGLFMVDESGEWARLRAGTGPAGQAMLNRGHRLNLRQNSMVSWSINNVQARVALDAGADQVRLATPELPFTRSEAALPLRSRGQVLGALTIQSDRPNAFDEATITVLQAMTDLVAIAMDNAHLLATSQAALEAERLAYGELTRTAWLRQQELEPDLCIRSTPQGTARAENWWSPEMARAFHESQAVYETTQTANEPSPLAVPVKVRGAVIGVLEALKPGASWKSDEINLMVQFADQLGLALDNARLYDETRLRADRERLTHELTDRLHRSNSIEDLMQLMVSEVAKALGATSSFLQLSVLPEPSTNAEPNKPNQIQLAEGLSASNDPIDPA